MLLYGPRWEDMIASLPPGEQAEIVAALAGRREDGQDAGDD
jgi:hypothetical protein